LRERKDYEFVCLARPSGGKSAMERTAEIIRDECVFDGCPEIADEVLSHITAIEGDVTTIDPEAMAKDPRMAGVEIVFHCAADVNLGKDPTGRVFKINYNGTQNVV
jgi:nucleoside-diphosphate-sugar epimerase